MKKFMKLVKAAAFIIIGIILFSNLSRVMTQNNVDHIDDTVTGLYEMPDNTIEVVSLGTSHMEFGFSPMELYQTTNITAYNLGTYNQSIASSYYLLRELYQTNQKPAYVLLDVSNLFFSDEGNMQNVSMRYIMDNMRFSQNKWEFIRTYQEKTDADPLTSCLFPIIKYHTRWAEITQEDFLKHGCLTYNAGQAIRSDINPSTYSLNDIDNQIKRLQAQSEGQITQLVNGNVTSETLEGTLYSAEITDLTRSYVEKIHALCKENGAQLILTKIPLRYMYVWYNSAWTKDKSELVQDLANDCDLPYYDLIYGEGAPDIDYTTDTIDNGIHLNVNGAKKVTQFWAEYFQDEGLNGQANALYDNMLLAYQKAVTVTDFETETTFNRYLSQLADKNILVLIAASDEFTNGLSKKNKKRLQKLGLDLATDSDYGASYAAIIDNGNVLYEASSNRIIEYSTDIDARHIVLKSAGYLNKPSASIQIDGKEYAVNSRGLNIVLYDKESQKVVDSVAFDTYRDSCEAKRTNIYSIFSEYENWLRDSFRIGADAEGSV